MPTLQKLPEEYAWLADEPAPRMLLEALNLYGTQEVVGKKNNPDILAWAEECNIKGYNADSIPWCGLFMAIVAHRSGKDLPSSPLWARSWAKWGTESPSAQLGDVLVFERGSGGHVGLYIGEDSDCYHVLGGNQGDAVSIKRIAKSRCLAVRRQYKIGVPPNVRRVLLSAAGSVSVNEA